MGRNPFEEKPARRRHLAEPQAQSIEHAQSQTPPIQRAQEPEPTINETLKTATAPLSAAVSAIVSATTHSHSLQKLQIQFDVDQFAETIFDGKFSQPIKTVAHMIANLKRST